MKKIIILCLSLLSLSISSDKDFFKYAKNIDNSFILDFELNDIQLETVGDYTKIKTDSKIGVTGVIGMPKS